MCSWAQAAAPVAKAGKTSKPTQGQPVPAPAAFKGDPVSGKEKAEAERCFECHSQDGQGQGHANGPEGKFAKLAGQFPEYMLKQLQDLKSGKRKHDQMAIMARSVEEEDQRDIIAYFASLPRMKGEGGGGADTPGSKLFQQGDPARGILACASCHGERGQGVGFAQGPVLGGQEWKYLEKQLQDWRSGFRHNDPSGVMNSVSKALTDAEIQSLTDYLAVQ
ncbi:MAG: c-type cytochrome [Rubrivivax sp.]|nr:MAG: c-type cytochrome [Rubrivivax sp.]